MDKQKIALVTGGSKGIGAAIAQTLAQDGFEIWLNYRSDHEGAAKVSKAIEQAGGRCRLLPFDVSDPADVEKHLQPLLENETPYALINNAGFTRDVILAWMTQEEWTDVLSVTLGGFFLVTKPVINNMLKKKGRPDHQYRFHFGTKRDGRPDQLFGGQGRPDRGHQGFSRRKWVNGIYWLMPFPPGL